MMQVAFVEQTSADHCSRAHATTESYSVVEGKIYMSIVKIVLSFLFFF